jgi:hypothetical protein
MVFFWDIDHDRAAPITIGLVHNRQFGRTALFQQVTWKSPIFLTCDLLNTWIASGVGCNRTLQSFFSKYASASGALVQLLAWERPTGAPQNWRHLLRAPRPSIGRSARASSTTSFASSRFCGEALGGRRIASPRRSESVGRHEVKMSINPTQRSCYLACVNWRRRPFLRGLTPVSGTSC